MHAYYTIRKSFKVLLQKLFVFIQSSGIQLFKWSINQFIKFFLRATCIPCMCVCVRVEMIKEYRHFNRAENNFVLRVLHTLAARNFGVCSPVLGGVRAIDIGINSTSTTLPIQICETFCSILLILLSVEFLSDEHSGPLARSNFLCMPCAIELVVLCVYALFAAFALHHTHTHTHIRVISILMMVCCLHLLPIFSAPPCAPHPRHFSYLLPTHLTHNMQTSSWHFPSNKIVVSAFQWIEWRTTSHKSAFQRALYVRMCHLTHSLNGVDRRLGILFCFYFCPGVGTTMAGKMARLLDASPCSLSSIGPI